MSLVPDPNNIRLAMIGMNEGNGHPYSWSAIVNGYDAEVMASCPYPVIPKYLGAQPPEALGIPGATVTHIWCENPDEARDVARASLIPNVVEAPQDVIGHVDAVFIPTDIGAEHAERARPFVEAGLPVFVDKPLTDNAADLGVFQSWIDAGKPILSSSCMRYAREFHALAERMDEVGEPRLIVSTTCKSWERYGIHALEGAYGLLRPGGWVWARNGGCAQSNLVHARHADGVDLVVSAVDDMYGSFGELSIHGTKGVIRASFEDTFFAFKTQLESFVQYLRTGVAPHDFSETAELIRIVIAGIMSREKGGQKVELGEITDEVAPPHIDVNV